MNLIELVEAGDVQGVLKALLGLTPEQRDAQHAALDAHFEPRDHDRWWRLEDMQREALASACLGTTTTPQEAADWLLSDRLMPRGCGWMVDVVNLYPAAWRAELVACILARTWRGSQEKDRFALAEHIILDTGCPLPTSGEFINAWLRDRQKEIWPTRPRHVLGGGRGDSLLARLRNDDFTPTLLPLAVTRPHADVWLCRRELVVLAAKGVVDRDALSRRTFADLAHGTPAAEAGQKLLAGEPLTPGEQDLVARTRTELVTTFVARLLQDGTREETDEPLTSLRALALTPAENAPLLRDHVAMLDLSALVAAYGQEVLMSLDEAGLLEDDVLTEICERVLLRPEKKLVRAQLAWLGRVAKRDTTRTGRLLTDAALTFQHREADLQERALDLVARHLSAADEQVLPGLRVAAASLGPGLTARAAELFGLPGQGTTEVLPDVLPDVPEPAPVHPVETAAEVAPEVAVLLADQENVVAFERALDGLVRHAGLDRSTLAKALEPVVRKTPDSTQGWTQLDLYDVAAAVRCDEPRYGHIHRRGTDPRVGLWDSGAITTPPGALLKARLTEAIELIESGTQPYLLALPTHANGALDAATLVARIADFESLGVAPAPIDLAQALLRVTPTDDERVREAAGALRSDAGRQLTRWLNEGGAPHRDTTPEEWSADDPTGVEGGRLEPAEPITDLDLALPPVAAALFGHYASVHPNWHINIHCCYYAHAFWLAQLPHHRDELAARLGDTDRRHLLPRLMEAHGTAGYATHWQIVRQLSWNPDAAMDALLVLAAQGQLDARLFAGQWWPRRDWSIHPRETAALRGAAETGAWATVWSILEAALPALLRDKPVKGAGAVLALAVECASRSGAKGSIPEVDEMAARKGSSQTVKNARLLRDVLR
ncbi:DUF6493 family protein [Streptomyces sp. NRRL S-813]|uniref:DUF7824 domain-containing protein n=1 Tax=Streptomyces sp. NRRL S-813 TaxID=1463919 RepID=UPI0004C05CA1|nr:DUF6493 family protein [Streptomyces sp. NRRL S-813]